MKIRHAKTKSGKPGVVITMTADEYERALANHLRGTPAPPWDEPIAPAETAPRRHYGRPHGGRVGWANDWRMRKHAAGWIYIEPAKKSIRPDLVVGLADRPGNTPGAVGTFQKHEED